ncbi:hypothetical protein D0864_04726 [Hortaea werneckii]|uniref:Uncharacterized protein n=1 Tax=Hortaea werneckii TaxID=91943 RepID=A0A3M7G8W3_HORWE|nr:hypothetical protein D0864_04726 [Hortaea werneckii]
MFGGPNPHTEATLPLTIGHKKSGKISEIGEDVSSFRIDGKIVIELLWTIATTSMYFWAPKHLPSISILLVFNATESIVIFESNPIGCALTWLLKNGDASHVIVSKITAQKTTQAKGYSSVEFSARHCYLALGRSECHF